MKDFRFAREVHQDLESTMDWLDEKRLGLGDELEHEFFVAVNKARSRPESFAPGQDGYRPVGWQFTSPDRRQ